MEILYPDVIGSGGAPKRIMKPRRRTDGAPADDAEMPGTGVLNLQGSTGSAIASPDQQQRPALSQTPTGSSTGSLPTQQAQQAATTSTTTLVPANTAATRSSSALTPPDETMPQAQPASQTRKRRTGPTGSQAEPESSPALVGTLSGPAEPATSSPQKRRRTSSRGGVIAPVLNSSTLPNQLKDSSSLAIPLVEELLDALKSRSVPRWREQALDIFFRDFAEEELDLQVKISENLLSNENKAMVFCKMPERVRHHWVGKYREMHQLNKPS